MFTPGSQHANTFFFPPDSLHRRIDVHLLHPGRQFADILAGATQHGAPLRPIVHLAAGMIQAERKKSLRQENAESAPPGWTRLPPPSAADTSRGTGWNNALLQHLLQRGITAAHLLQQGWRGSVKTQNVAQHQPERRPQQIGFRANTPARSVPAHSRSGLLQGQRKRHIARMHVYPQQRKQADQIGIGAIVVHQKTGIHRVDPSSVTSTVLLWPPSRESASNKCHMMALRQQPGRSHAGNTAAYHCNFHILHRFGCFVLYKHNYQAG